MNLSKYHFQSLFLLSFLIGSLFLNACKKEVATYDLSGKVFDPQLKKNVSSANISLKASKVQSGIYNPNYTEIQSVNTSSDGSFYLKVDYDNVSGYQVDVSKNNYFDESIRLKTDDIQNPDGLSLNIDLIPIAHIEIRIKNTTPQAADDEIRVHFSNVDVKCKDCWNNDTIVGIGPSYNFSKTAQVSGEKKMVLKWVVKKNGIQHVYKDTILSKAFTTVTYNIDY